MIKEFSKYHVVQRIAQHVEEKGFKVDQDQNGQFIMAYIEGIDFLQASDPDATKVTLIIKLDESNLLRLENVSVKSFGVPR